MSAATELTNKIIDFIYRQGAFRTAAKKGVADVLACFGGRLIAIEIKIGKDQLSPEQEGFILSVKHAGGIAFVVHDFEEFLSCWNEEVVDNFSS